MGIAVNQKFAIFDFAWCFGVKNRLSLLVQYLRNANLGILFAARREAFGVTLVNGLVGKLVWPLSSEYGSRVCKLTTVSAGLDFCRSKCAKECSVVRLYIAPLTATGPHKSARGLLFAELNHITFVPLWSYRNLREEQTSKSKRISLCLPCTIYASSFYFPSKL